MTKALQLTLLGAFFILNAMNGYTDLVRPVEPFILSVWIALLALLCYLLSCLAFRQHEKRWVSAFFLLFFLLFARNIFSAVKDLSPGLRPSYFFGASALAMTLAWWLTKRSSPLKLARFNNFLRLTLVVLIAYELAGIVFSKPQQPFTLNAPVLPGEWRDNAKPNIYVLLFDEYQGNKGLASMAGFDNGKAMSMLRDHGFSIASDPVSPYRSTIYSLPALFQMDTLAFTGEEALITGRSAIMANRMLNGNNVFLQYLKDNGYRTDSYSLFTIDGNKPEQPYPIGLSWLELVELKILPWWAKYDLFNALPSNAAQKKLGTLFASGLAYNRSVIEKTLASIDSSGGPKFVFSHLLLPHPPVMLDSTGRERSLREAMYELNLRKPGFNQAYISQLAYTNQVMQEMVEKISRQDPRAVVLILSDHGCRAMAQRTPEVFNIQWAMRIPGKDSLSAGETINLVNTFRILLNHVAGQALPMVDAHPKY